MIAMSRAKSSTRPHGSGPRLTSAATTPAKSPARKPIKSARTKASGGRKSRSRSGGGGHPTKPRFWLRRSFWSWLVSSAFVGLFFVIGALLYFASDLPSISGLETTERQPGITIKTSEGITLSSYGDVYGHYVAFEDIPESLIQAVLATEDRRFFDHMGIDVMGIARAMVVNLRAGRLVQGGSTITQQVAKNVFLTPERTIKRKIQEMLLAFWLESKFTKEQIFAIYLNRVYLGSGNYGIDAASRRYFDKPATEVNLIESAILTGLLKAPSRYSPLSSAERAKNRAHQVLLNMVDAGFLSEGEVKEALKTFKPPRLYREGDASGTRYFTDWIVEEVPLYIGKVDQDVIVTTTLDPKLQREAEDALVAIMNEHGAEKNASQAALVSMAPDGAIRALVGGRSYKESQYNRVTQAIRQPGSVFKLFVYLAALEAGIAPQWLVDDAPVEVPTGVRNRMWRPQNFDQKFRGEITIREALTHSVNTVSVQLAMAVGLDKVVDMARRLGVTGIEPQPSIALGAVDSNLLDITAAYAHLANQGRGVQPYGITSIQTQDGEMLYEREGSGLWVVLRESVVRHMTYMLENVPKEGTGRRANIGRPMAGKTGTSSDFRDAWFVGFTPQLVTGVWVGNDDNTSMKKVTGGNLPAMIWKDFMQLALEGQPVQALMSSGGEPVVERLPWQQPAESDVLNLFRSNEPTGVTREQPARPVPLERSFWDTLFGEGGETEYDYPSNNPRERGIQR